MIVAIVLQWHTYKGHLMAITRHDININEYKFQAETGLLLDFEPLLQTHLWIHVLSWNDQHV
jgi:hypothetical protein